MSQDRTPQCSCVSAVTSLRLDRQQLPTSPTLAGDPPVAQSSPAAAPTPRGKPRTGAGRARAHRAVRPRDDLSARPMPGCAGGPDRADSRRLARSPELRSRAAAIAATIPRSRSELDWAATWRWAPARCGRSGNRSWAGAPVRSSRGWTASSGWDRFWLAIAASTWARAMLAGRTAGCRPLRRRISGISWPALWPPRVVVGKSQPQVDFRRDRNGACKGRAPPPQTRMPPGRCRRWL